MAYDPNILASIAGAAIPGGKPNPVAVTPGGGAGDAAAPPPAEPVALHDAALKAQEAVKAAREALEELSEMADMADTIDPSVEKVIAAAAESIAEVDDGIDDAVEQLGTARSDHEELVSAAADA